MNLIGTTKPVRATKALMMQNDCPSNCKKDYCDVCPFRRNSKKTTSKK